MAYISNYLFTGINHNITFNSALENPISYSDTFTVGSDLYFGMNISFLNQLRTSMGQSTIAAPGIGNYTVTVFLCDSIDGSLNFVNVKNTKQYVLGPLQTNAYIYESINTILENYSNNDQLLESMRTTEIQKLKKSFKIIFRINLNSSPVLTQSIQNGDLVQDLYILADTMQPGPYEVVFENVDILSPNDFSDAERKAAYSANINLLAFEGMRCFYPQNLSTLGPIPLVVCVRANGGNVESYDPYLSLFASYGYFCICLFQDVSSNSVFLFDNGIYNMPDAYKFGVNQGDTFIGAIETGSYHHSVITIGYLDHIKKNLNKINSGKFNNKIDFTKIIPMGHSRGGGAVYNLYELLLYKSNANNLILKFNTDLLHTSIKGIICLAPNKGDVLQSTGSICNIGSPVVIPEAQSSVVPPWNPNIPGLTGARYCEYIKGISQGQFSLLNSSTTAKLKLNTNIPLLFLFPEYDMDTNLNTLVLYRSSNLNSSGSVINNKKIILIKKLSHNGVSNPAWMWYTYNGMKSIKGYDVPSASGIIFNNLSSRIMYLASKTLEFIANSVYSANINSDIFNNPNDFNNRKKSLMECFEYTEEPVTNTIVNTIDTFDSVNFTTNISGYTLASAIDKSVKDHLTFISESGYTLAPDLYSKGMIFFQDATTPREGNTYPEDITDKLYSASGKGLLISYNSSNNVYNVTYTYGSPRLNIASAKFIKINAAQITSAPLNTPTLIETPLTFSLSFTDTSNRAATLSCLNYNDGIADPSTFVQAQTTEYSYSQVNSINFRLQDFIQKTPNLDFSNIQQIDLYFGSAYGSTQGTVFIDSIYAI